jgi:hypothetical protein
MGHPPGRVCTKRTYRRTSIRRGGLIGRFVHQEHKPDMIRPKIRESGAFRVLRWSLRSCGAHGAANGFQAGTLRRERWLTTIDLGLRIIAGPQDSTQETHRALPDG